MSKRTRLNPEDRKRLILNAAIEVAIDRGLFNFGLVHIARSLPGTSRATIKHYFTMDKLRTAIVHHLLDQPSCMLPDHTEIVAQAVAMDHESVSYLSDNDRAEYLKCLA